MPWKGAGRAVGRRSGVGSRVAGRRQPRPLQLATARARVDFAPNRLLSAAARGACRCARTAKAESQRASERRVVEASRTCVVG